LLFFDVPADLEKIGLGMASDKMIKNRVTVHRFLKERIITSLLCIFEK
jgi:hypothetical protein